MARKSERDWTRDDLRNEALGTLRAFDCLLSSMNRASPFSYTDDVMIDIDQRLAALRDVLSSGRIRRMNQSYQRIGNVVAFPADDAVTRGALKSPIDPEYDHTS